MLINWEKNEKNLDFVRRILNIKHAQVGKFEKLKRKN